MGSSNIRITSMIMGVRRHFRYRKLPASYSLLEIESILSSFQEAGDVLSQDKIEVSKAVVLTEEVLITYRGWQTLNLPGGEEMWGARTDEATFREVLLARSVGLDCLLPLEWDEFELEPGVADSHLTNEAVFGFDHCFPMELVQTLKRNPSAVLSLCSDTLGVSRTAYTYLKPDSIVSQSARRPGYVFMVPIAGPLADSLAIGSIPSLPEFAWAALDVGLTYGGYKLGEWVYRSIAVNNADDTFRAILYANTPDELLVTNARTNQLREALLAADKMTPSQIAHHIVGLNDDRAALSRQILQMAGVSIDDIANGVGLNPAVHSRIHTNLYFSEIERRLLNAYGGANASVRGITGSQVRGVLRTIRNELLAGTFPY